MQLDPAWLQAQPAEDAMLLHFVDTAFFRKPPARIAVAVSGGGDSMALLHVYSRWSQQTGHPIEAVTVDHGLRPEAAREIALVARFCATANIDHSVLKWQSWDGTGNFQAEARAARYRLIADWATARGIAGVALAHTRDDIAETFLMRLARKSGLEGLAAMEPRFERHGLRWVRPFWQQGREDLREYLTRNEIDWADDPSNDDPRFDRVKARTALKALAPLGIDAETLHHSAFALYIANSALEHYTRVEASEVIREDRGDLIISERPPVSEEIKRRLLNAALQWVGGDPYPPRWGALMDLDAGLAEGSRHTLAGCLVTRSDKSKRVTREYNAVRALTGPTDALWDRRWRLEGPHDPALSVRALGEGVNDCPDWRATGLPRDSLRASPAIWQDDTLVAAPLAGHNPVWSAQIVAPFTEYLEKR